MNIRENCSIKRYTTFGVDANVRYFVEYDSVEDLKSIITSGLLNDKRFLCIGGGSNLLFCNTYDGVLLHSCIKDIEVIERRADSVIVRVGAGVVWDDFVKYCVDNEWYGAENLSLIPGEVGASPVQNIGAYGVEAKDLIYRVECLNVDTAEFEILTNKECAFGYRDSAFKHDLKNKMIVTHVQYKLNIIPSYKLDYGTIHAELEGQKLTLAAVREAVISIRESKLPDPRKLGNAGSFFKNPVVSESVFKVLQSKYPQMPHFAVSEGVKIPAAWLIEQSGWKGKQLGSVAVYEKQPLVLVNLGGATGSDVAALSDKVCAAVKCKFGIEIVPEVIFVR